MSQIVNNLLLNSVKFSPPDGVVTLSVSYAREAPNPSDGNLAGVTGGGGARESSSAVTAAARATSWGDAAAAAPAPAGQGWRRRFCRFGVGQQSSVLHEEDPPPPPLPEPPHLRRDSVAVQIPSPPAALPASLSSGGHPHGAAFACGADPSSPCEGFIVFSVEDSGIGIASEMLEQIFSAFKQAEGGIGRRFGGWGLGLAVRCCCPNFPPFCFLSFACFSSPRGAPLLAPAAQALAPILPG